MRSGSVCECSLADAGFGCCSGRVVRLGVGGSFLAFNEYWLANVVGNDFGIYIAVSAWHATEDGLVGIGEPCAAEHRVLGGDGPRR